MLKIFPSHCPCSNQLIKKAKGLRCSYNDCKIFYELTFDSYGKISMEDIFINNKRSVVRNYFKDQKSKFELDYTNIYYYYFDFYISLDLEEINKILVLL